MMISFVSYHELLPIVMLLVVSVVDVVEVVVVLCVPVPSSYYCESFPKSHHYYYYCDDDVVVVVVSVYDWKINVTWLLVESACLFKVLFIVVIFYIL